MLRNVLRTTARACRAMPQRVAAVTHVRCARVPQVARCMSSSARDGGDMPAPEITDFMSEKAMSEWAKIALQPLREVHRALAELNTVPQSFDDNGFSEHADLLFEFMQQTANYPMFFFPARVDGEDRQLILAQDEEGGLVLHSTTSRDAFDLFVKRFAAAGPDDIDKFQPVIVPGTEIPDIMDQLVSQFPEAAGKQLHLAVDHHCEDGMLMHGGYMSEYRDVVASVQTEHKLKGLASVPNEVIPSLETEGAQQAMADVGSAMYFTLTAKKPEGDESEEAGLVTLPIPDATGAEGEMRLACLMFTHPLLALRFLRHHATDSLQSLTAAGIPGKLIMEHVLKPNQGEHKMVAMVNPPVLVSDDPDGEEAETYYQMLAGLPKVAYSKLTICDPADNTGAWLAGAVARATDGVDDSVDLDALLEELKGVQGKGKGKGKRRRGGKGKKKA